MLYTPTREYVGYIQEYDQILLGKQKRFTNTRQITEDVVIEILKYACSYYLNWDPYDVRDNLTQEVLERLKLWRFIKYINFPKELDKDKDLFYLAHLMYPETIKYDIRDAVLRVYRGIVNQEIGKNGKVLSFSKKFFSDEYGEQRAAICLQEMISTHMSFKSVRDMYRQFADNSINGILKQYQLFDVCKQLYVSPLDYLHESLPESMQSEFWYHYYQFEDYYKAADRKVRYLKPKKD